MGAEGLTGRGPQRDDRLLPASPGAVMNPVEIIARKRDGAELTKEEIDCFVRGVTDGSIADYQASAWLMAVYLKGMTGRETRDLTLAMRDSGAKIDLSDLKHGLALDKHST